MSKYQITATVEKIEIQSDDAQFVLKGVGKNFFESEIDGKKKSYNILEPVTSNDEEKPFPLMSNEKFRLKKDVNGVIGSLLSHGFIENKRLKFEIEKVNKGNYTITSISKAD
ncbi:MAG: hypothetical protein LBU83_11705 [Bacteroidales bacterium]|jgi:hypothetical protein|nr:hypothetical protein [Bacteroidales bacterium]